MFKIDAVSISLSRLTKLYPELKERERLSNKEKLINSKATAQHISSAKQATFIPKEVCGGRLSDVLKNRRSTGNVIYLGKRRITTTPPLLFLSLAKITLSVQGSLCVSDPCQFLGLVMGETRDLCKFDSGLSASAPLKTSSTEFKHYITL